MTESPIQTFYNNQTIFLTGGTGFLGKHLLSKLLISCNNVKKIYLLIREKKGKSAENRVNTIFESFFFDSLKKKVPNYRNKIGIIKGDCELPQLGLSQQDKQLLEKEVTCILHVSATVRFDEDLAIASKINVKALQDLIKLAKKMKNLKVFVYVSTAYSNCNQNVIKETFYDPPMSSNELFDFVTELKEEIDESILGKWPNTYTFTKAIAENVIKKEAQTLPIVIVRPGIVLGPVKEPEPGCFDTIQGISALSLGVYIGLIHVVFMSKQKITFIVPSDYVANHILAAAWHLDHQKSTKIPIYNYIGSKKNLITWDMYTKMAITKGRNLPPLTGIWWSFMVPTDNKFWFLITNFLFHMLPAILADLTLRLLGKKAQPFTIYRKIEKNLKLVIPFTTNTWTFDNSNVDKLWENMALDDKEIFNFNMDTINWLTYFEDLTHVARVHVLKDPIDTLSKARKKQFFFKILHYAVLGLFLFLMYKFLSIIFVVSYKGFNMFSTHVYKQKFDLNQ